MRDRSCKGIDVLLGAGRRGAVGPRGIVGAAAPAAKKYIVMHIDDPNGLVAHEKGPGIAFFTNALVPDYVENQIYSTVKDQLQQQFKDRGSTVSVDITQSPPTGIKPRSDLAGGVALGVVLSAIGLGIFKLVRRGK